ncbi:Protein BTG1 [Amphibalanus amphitrite]|uniref:Protein BTG1 n=1 Tax=Amphibalanus amphitrite TaxID=1232801 RepID=A0A6A4W8T1_AMPAM|nr:protein BTG2-like [Amphibalanus amphitrite]XP_043238040.1 protein BTG2-like [Amphibalanus amphitrite]KAF0300184.1 Protein BTG1 [Amphibalanus amphitrite]
MKSEVMAASDFIVNLLRMSSPGSLSERELLRFRDTLALVMRNHYHNHWFPEKSYKGSGYRCIRINGQMDPLVAAAGDSCGLDRVFLRSLFPSELTMWVDPREVSYRIGENGSICVLFDERVERPRADGCKDMVRPAYGGFGDQWSTSEPMSACAFS